MCLEWKIDSSEHWLDETNYKKKKINLFGLHADRRTKNKTYGH